MPDSKSVLHFPIYSVLSSAQQRNGVPTRTDIPGGRQKLHEEVSNVYRNYGAVMR